MAITSMKLDSHKLQNANDWIDLRARALDSVWMLLVGVGLVATLSEFAMRNVVIACQTQIEITKVPEMPSTMFILHLYAWQPLRRLVLSSRRYCIDTTKPWHVRQYMWYWRAVFPYARKGFLIICWTSNASVDTSR